MTPDLSFVTDAFNRFNTLIFDGNLPAPRFRMTHARTFRGKLVYSVRTVWGRRKADDFEMRISLDFDLPQTEWEDVVIHEMIHLHIASRGIKDSSSHGPKFRALMTEINRLHGRKICVTAKSTKEQLDSDKRMRGHYLCIARFTDGRFGVAPVAKSRIFELWDAFSRWADVVSVSWIGTVDPWFNRFPRVMSPKLYMASRDDLLLHLKGALRLERNPGPSGYTIRALATRTSPDALLP